MELIEQYKDNALFYQFKEFNNYNHIKHLFTSRVGWTNENIKYRISDIFNVPKSNIVSVKQVHGTDIKIIDSKVNNFIEFSKLETDGLITNLTDIVLATYHADCVPIYFFDKVDNIVGIAHGGWRGTFDNISGKMIDTFKRRYSSNNNNILVAIGPSIGPCCYEVGEDVMKQFTNRYDNFRDILVRRNGKVYLDLWKINYLQVVDKGIPKDNIILSNTCTSCKVNKFYSYRKENGTDNRMIAAICLK
ncbi:peptidoglycan editing factor PgeF [Schnuerera sp. xch1]|uniref:peptidoglycan editing factor PgeF n=1 Tax=Schnuerera sp. xch1 TaxID=2874283 RepID=UPI001CBDE86E|nr:peptidoglycan editing factor PgeF [Schnuerera sp. xch1]MBZ2173687.1 peptidoglycan editing factor PgeF [Schnuerera sp. xch1]